MPTDFQGRDVNSVRERTCSLGPPRAAEPATRAQGFSGGEKKRNEVLQMSLLKVRRPCASHRPARSCSCM